MKKRYMFTLFFIAVVFAGCAGRNDTTVKECISAGWAGIVITVDSPVISCYCSNGDKSPSGKSFITHAGNKPVDHFMYFKLGE